MAAQISDFTYTPLKIYKLLNKKSQKKQALNQLNKDIVLPEIITNKQKSNVNINKNRPLCIVSDRTRSYTNVIKYISSTYRLISQKHNLDLNVVIEGQGQKKTMLIDVTIDVNYLIVSSDNFVIKSSNDSKINNLIILCDEFHVKCAIFSRVISLKLFGRPQKMNPYKVDLYLTSNTNIFELMSVFGEIHVSVGKSGVLLLTCLIDFDIKIIGDMNIFHFISRSFTLVKYLNQNDDLAFDIVHYDFAELLDKFNDALDNPESNRQYYLFLVILSQQLYAMYKTEDTETDEVKYLLNLLNKYEEFFVSYCIILTRAKDKRLIYNALRKVYLPYHQKTEDEKKLVQFYSKLIKKDLGIRGKCRQFL